MEPRPSYQGKDPAPEAVIEAHREAGVADCHTPCPLHALAISSRQPAPHNKEVLMPPEAVIRTETLPEGYRLTTTDGVGQEEKRGSSLNGPLPL